MQALKIYNHGPVEGLKSVDVELPPLEPGFVLVEVLAAGINPSDALSAKGGFPHSPLPRILGRDFAGRVVDGPPELIGLDVWGSGGDLGISRDGTHAEYLQIPAGAVSARPNNLTVLEAASVGVPFQTAYVALVERGGVKPGEWVVISGATGAVGTAATKIANATGAQVIALVKNKDDEPRLTEKVAAIAHLEENDLVDVVKGFTGGKGADLAINGIGGAAFQPLLDSLSEFGRMSIFSVLSGQDVTVNLKQVYRNNISLFGVNTATVDACQGAEILNKLRPLFESGAITAPAYAETFPLSNAAEAYLSLAKGKILVIPDRVL